MGKDRRVTALRHRDLECERGWARRLRIQKPVLPRGKWQRGSRRLPWAFLLVAGTLLQCAMGEGPMIQKVEDVVIKACSDNNVRFLPCPADSACNTGEAHLILDHSDPALKASLVVTIQSVSPPIVSSLSPLRDVVVRSVSGHRVISVCPRGKAYGKSTVVLTVTDTNGLSINTQFDVSVQALAPVFDDAGPSRTVVDLRTIVGTPTYPYTFLVGHEDPDMVHKLSINAFSAKPMVIPSECCSQTQQYLSTGGIFLEMQPYEPTADLAFVVGSLKAQARKTNIVIRPSSDLSGDVRLTLRLTDGNTTTLSFITVFVRERPQLDKFCAYDVMNMDTLGLIANQYGMHWMTLYLMNNHTLKHPDSIVPGTRLSLGRPYIVKKGDSLYSIAVRFGTTWQHIHKLNPAIVPDEKNLFEGQLLCLAPDLAAIACRHEHSRKSS